MFCEMFFFFFTNFSQGNFLFCSRFLILIKNVNTARTHTETKPVALNFFFFFHQGFCQVVKHQSKRVVFFSSCKITFCNDDSE